MTTVFQRKEDTQKNRKWVLVDAQGQVVGRLATRIADILRGKGKANFDYHNDCGDFVVVVNADKVVLTGRKMERKVYHHHTGFAGGVKTFVASDLLERDPAELLSRTVRGMLPKSALGKRQLKKLRIFRGTEHEHQAQVGVQSAN